MCVLEGTFSMFSNNVVANAKSVNSVVNHSRKVYYNVNKHLNSYKKNQIKGEYTEYWKKKKLKKAITYPTSVSDAYVKKYIVEYYYDSENHLVFAYAYRKAKGKMQEYRAYYGTDSKLYRYIDTSGKIHDYSEGKNIKSFSNSLRYVLYKKGAYYWNLAMETEYPNLNK